MQRLLGALALALLLSSDSFAQFPGFPPAGTVLTGNGTSLPAFSPTFTFTQNWLITGVITPTALSGDVNNYNPAGISTASAMRIDGGAANRNITGLTAQSAGTRIAIYNIGSSNNLVLKTESASSTAANRFTTGTDVTLTPSQVAELWYDGTSSRWRMTATSPGTTTGAGVPTNVQRTATSGTSIATSDCGHTVLAGTGTSGGFTVTLPSVSGFDTTCRVTIKNGDAARGKVLSGFPTNAPPVLFPLQTIEVGIVNGAWAMLNNPGMWVNHGAVTFYLDSANGSDSNDCMAAGAGNACLTPTHAITQASLYVWNTANITFQYADATWTNTPFISQLISGPGSIIIQGNTGTPANAVLYCSAPCGATGLITISHPGNYFIQGFQFTTATPNMAGIFASGAGTVVTFQSVDFAAFNGTSWHLFGIKQATIDNTGNYSLSGNATTHIECDDSAVCHLATSTITIAASRTFTTFAVAHGLGLIGTGAVYGGSSFTGVKGTANLNGVIDGCSSIPGSSACTNATGGQVN